MGLDGLFLKHVMWMSDMQYFPVGGEILHTMEEERLWAETALVQIPAWPLAKFICSLCLSPHICIAGTLLLILQGCYEDLMR